MAAKPKPVDWAKVSAEYRAGVRTLRDIGDEHGITEGAIRKRAKAEQWPRDLSEKIKARAEEMVRKEMVRSGTILRTEKVVIETNAQLQANTLLTQRKDIQQYRALANKLYAEIEAQTSNPEEFERLREILVADPDSAALVRAQEAYRKVLTSPSRIDSFKKLTETLKTLVGLERQAIGLSDNANGEGDKPKDPPDAGDAKDTAKRIAFIFAQAMKGA